jgi:hypothetical protein
MNRSLPWVFAAVAGASIWAAGCYDFDKELTDCRADPTCVTDAGTLRFGPPEAKAIVIPSGAAHMTGNASGSTITMDAQVGLSAEPKRGQGGTVVIEGTMKK